MQLVVSLALLVQGLSAPTPEVAWVKAHAIPLQTVEAGHGSEDLQPLKELVGDARIVALGECTHGTREIFQMKHRLTEFLASEMGFTLFSIEASTPEAYRVDDFVSRGEGDPAELIRGMYFWTWSTAEVLDMVRWMRAFNEQGSQHIAFTGFDMQTPDVAEEIVASYLAQHAPEAAAKARETYARTPGPAKAGFGVATGTFPVEACRDKRIRYSGWIRTEGVAGGRAGLWWRVDGPGREMLGFDNMQNRGPSGDSDWTEYSIELDVPAEAINVNFGLIMTGSGQAWFDAVAVAVDGEPWEDSEHFDLGFESGEIRGFFSPLSDYEVKVVDDQALDGAQSLRISKTESEEPEHDATAYLAEVREIREGLEARRAELVAASSDKDFDWALHCADIVEQGARLDTLGIMGGHVRDLCMAKNVEWILEQNPEARIVLWAHNGHVMRAAGTMGSHLAKRFGEDYVVLGFAGREGTYTAIRQGALKRDNTLALPPADSVESVLHEAGMPLFVLDVRSASTDDPASAFLATERPFRSIGALAMEEQFYPANVQKAYDGVIWIEKSSASRAMQ